MNLNEEEKALITYYEFVKEYTTHIQPPKKHRRSKKQPKLYKKCYVHIHSKSKLLFSLERQNKK
jgi:hypothetical protein